MCPSLSKIDFCDPENINGVTLGKWLFDTGFVYENKEDAIRHKQRLKSIPEVEQVEVTETGDL